MAQEGDLAIVDLVQAQLVECAPEPASLPLNPVTVTPLDDSPVQQAMTATIETTGADPPPWGLHG